MSKFIRQSDISDAQIDAAIEKVAHFIVERYEFQDLALLFLETNYKVMSPLYRIYGELALFNMTPFQPFLGILGGDALELSALRYVNIFKDKQNVERLIHRIQEMAKQKEKEKLKEKGTTKTFFKGLTSRLKRFFS
jgi:hypothetical protein